MPEARDIKLQASGNWAGVVTTLAPQLSKAIEKAGRHTACPTHGGKDGFRVFRDFQNTGGGICNTCGEFADGLALLQWANEWSFKKTLKAVNEFLNGTTSAAQTKQTRSLAQPERKPCVGNQRAIHKTLNQCQRINWPVAYYLKNRGLNNLAGRVPDDLKAINSLPYWNDGQLVGSFPAMIGIVRNLDGEVVTLHRTYLTEQGYKAKTPNPKKLMSPSIAGATSGCAIQLYKPTDKLAITEGIETALAVHLATGFPVWAAISAIMLEKVKIPACVKEVYIMADKDRSGAGEHSARMLAQRLALHHSVKIILPEPPIPDGEKSIDWLDIYQRETGFNVIPLYDEVAG